MIIIFVILVVVIVVSFIIIGFGCSRNENIKYKGGSKALQHIINIYSNKEKPPRHDMTYRGVMDELKYGNKQSHWSWAIFIKPYGGSEKSFNIDPKEFDQIITDKLVWSPYKTVIREIIIQSVFNRIPLSTLMGNNSNVISDAVIADMVKYMWSIYFMFNKLVQYPNDRKLFAYAITGLDSESIQLMINKDNYKNIWISTEDKTRVDDEKELVEIHNEALNVLGITDIKYDNIKDLKQKIDMRTFQPTTIKINGPTYIFKFINDFSNDKYKDGSKLYKPGEPCANGIVAAVVSINPKSPLKGKSGLLFRMIMKHDWIELRDLLENKKDKSTNIDTLIEIETKKKKFLQNINRLDDITQITETMTSNSNSEIDNTDNNKEINDKCVSFIDGQSDYTKIEIIKIEQEYNHLVITDTQHAQGSAQQAQHSSDSAQKHEAMAAEAAASTIRSSRRRRKKRHRRRTRRRRRHRRRTKRRKRRGGSLE